MKKQPFVTCTLAGLNITSFGMKIPSPFCSLTLNNSETDSYTSWELSVTVGGDSTRQVNIAAFEALIYSAAQTSGYANASGVPVTFMLGWLNDAGEIETYLSYQGWTMKYNARTSGMFMTYSLTGYASQIVNANTPVFNIPRTEGIVQPSAVLEGLAKSLKATDYYELDIDHCDAPTLVSHNAMTTSLTTYVRGDRTGEDDYDSFPGLLSLSKSYNSSRDAAGLTPGSGKLSTLMNNVGSENIGNYLSSSITDKTPQSSTFSFWVDEPTMTQPGVIHYKCTSTIMTTKDSRVLKYGTPDSNILSLSGSYDGIAYNMSDMSFSTLGFTLDDTGTTIVNPYTVTNSWSNSLSSVYQTANIINDINALSTQFSGDFTVTIPGATRGYTICEPITLLVMAGNTVSPVTGIYNIKSVSHTISTTFVTTIKLQRLSISSANQVATSAGIYAAGSRNGSQSSYETTSNIISTSKVDFGTLYPTWADVQTM